MEKRTQSEEIFDTFGDSYIAVEGREHLTIEELYLAFRARMVKDMKRALRSGSQKEE